MIGKTIGQYQVIDKIGEGGMGAVYKAEDTTLHRLVALKMLSGHLTEDEEAQERFIREAQSASSLNHPNITTVYEFLEDEDTRLICMEYVEGKTIRDMVESGIVSVRKAIDIIMQAAEALEAAHNKGILHRDVKSANIMVNMEGRVKVMDFGLAHLEERSQLTRTGTTMGTLSYSSPEHISGRPVDRRSEIFSLGVVFYELLTGQLPFKATSEAEILFAIINNEPAKLTKVREDVPELVEVVVSRMLEKDPELRYQTCGDVISDLKGIRKEMETSTVGVTGVLERVQAGRKKDLVTRVVIGALSIAIIATGLLLLTRSGIKLDPEKVVVDVFENRTGDESLEELGKLTADYLTEGLRGHNIADVVPTNLATQSHEYLESQYGESIKGDDRLREFAKETGAGLVVSGSYYIINEELIFKAELINAQNMKLIGSIEDVKGSSDTQMEVIELLRQRVMAFIALHFDPMFESATSYLSQPPTLESLRMYTRSIETFFGNQPEAIRLGYEAYRLDTSWLTPLTFILAPISNRNRFTELDSLINVLKARSEELTPLEILTVDYYDAKIKGNLREKSLIAAEIASIASDHNYSAGMSAQHANYPGEAVEFLERMDPKRGFLRQWPAYWSYYISSLHMLGDHREELKIVRWGQKLYPNANALVRAEAYALATLGKIRKIDELMERAFSLPGEAASRRNLARELKVHGHPEKSAEIINNLIEWYESRPEDEKSVEDYRIGFAVTLSLSERWRESGLILEELCTEFPDNLSYLLRLGVYSARSDDNERAMDIISQLAGIDRPYTFGSPDAFQAFIYGWLGEKEEAVRLLRTAHRQGYKYGIRWHRSELYEPLWDYPAFQELLRPKG